MAEEYKLLSGSHSRRKADGSREIFHPGDVLELTEAEKDAFGDKFELVTRASKVHPVSPLPAISRLSIKKVLNAVKKGVFTANAALEAELSRKKPRAALVAKLTAMLE